MVRRKDTTSSSNGTNNSSVGARLRAIRDGKGITLSELEKLIGYTKGYISSIETGQRPLPRNPKFLQDYARGLGLSPEEVNALAHDPSAVEIERSNIPHSRNDFFIGREEEIKQIHDNLTDNVSEPHICAITGISGIGKTTAAVEYAFRHRDEYQFTLWVQADTSDALSMNFAELANFLDLPEKNAQNRKTTISIVKQWLQVNSRCLLIFDNVDETSIEEDLLSQLGRNHIILTTRTQLLGPAIQNVELTQISEEDSVLLLLRQSHLVSPKADFSKVPDALKIEAQQITAILGGLPFALSHAATYIEKTKCGSSYYLKILQKEQSNLLKDESTSAAIAPIATWSLSFKEIRKSHPEAAELLYLCAFLYPDMIPRELFSKVSSVLPPKLAAITSDRGELNQAIQELLRYSLMQVDARSGAFSLHRLVQATIRNSLSLGKQQQWAEYTVRAINLAFPLIEIATWPTSWPTCQLYYYQAKTCVNLIEEWKIVNNESRQLLHKLGKYLVERTEFKNAERVYQIALELDKQAEKDPQVLIRDLYILAQFYQRRGNYKRAEECYKQFLPLLNIEEAIDNDKDLITDYLKILRSLNKMEEVKKVQAAAGINIAENNKISKNRRVINDAEEDIKYEEMWTYNARRWSDYGKDAHITNQPGASFQYTFTGYGIEIISDPSTFQGEIDIFIDGDHVQTVHSALFEGQISQTIIFSDVSLGQGEHIVKGQLVNGTFALDALAVYAEEENMT